MITDEFAGTVARIAAELPAAGGSRAALHAKLIAADTSTALTSSANLTDRALSHNLEVGVVLHDSALIGRLVAHFRALMDPDTAPLHPLRRGTPPAHLRRQP